MGYNLLNVELGHARRTGDLTFEHLLSDSDTEDSSANAVSTISHPPKKRGCCWTTFHTPNSSRFADHYHSRLLQKFPFLIEMFYWSITFAFHQCTNVLAQVIFSKTGIWDVAQDHGLAVLEFEELSWLSFLWPITELEVQQWFMERHQTFLAFLNRSYALIHIPGTVGHVTPLLVLTHLVYPLTVCSFIAWWYYIAPSHATFAIVRRTLILTNFMAFFVFICFPVMPPRLLPEEYGFVDSVRHDDGQSVWMQGDYVNSLAAMPSMRFGYSFCIGCTMMYHSGVGRKTLEPDETRKSTTWALFYALLAVAYPSWIFITIIATANHYYLDAIIAIVVATIAFLCNKVFLGLLPLEDLLVRCLRLEKPVPTTGVRISRGIA
jgi:hypothetical protein